MSDALELRGVHARPRPNRAGWVAAYGRFLASRHEPLLLKIAPLALVGILPPELLSNLIPGIGFLDDAGYIVLLVVVAYQTFTHVNRYRRPQTS